MSMISALIIFALIIGACRRKAFYGCIIVALSFVMRHYATIGDDLWVASCIFMIIGAVYIAIFPVIDQKC